MLATAGVAAGSAGAGEFTAVAVATALNQPLAVAFAPNDPDHLFVVEKPGVVEVLDLTDGTLHAEPFLDIAVSQGGSRGLRDLCFDPEYATNGFFYVAYNQPGTHGVILARFSVSGDPYVAARHHARDALAGVEQRRLADQVGRAAMRDLDLGGTSSHGHAHLALEQQVDRVGGRALVHQAVARAELVNPRGLSEPTELRQGNALQRGCVPHPLHQSQ